MLIPLHRTVEGGSVVLGTWLALWTPQTDDFVYAASGQQTDGRMGLDTVDDGLVALKDVRDDIGFSFPYEEVAIVRSNEDG